MEDEFIEEFPKAGTEQVFNLKKMEEEVSEELPKAVTEELLNHKKMEEEFSEVPKAVTEEVIHIDLSRENSIRSMDSINQVLDDIEQQVENLRIAASKLGEERDDILTTLETMAGQDNLDKLDEVTKEEVAVVVARLAKRANTILINVDTPRSESQAQALSQVNSSINDLILLIQTDSDKARETCIRYMSACDIDCGNQGAMDLKFEKILLGCTAEDQKGIKKRMKGLYEHITVIDKNDNEKSNI